MENATPTDTNLLTEWHRARGVARNEADKAYQALKFLLSDLQSLVLDFGRCEDRAWAREHVAELTFALSEVGSVASQFECELGWAIGTLAGPSELDDEQP